MSARIARRLFCTWGAILLSALIVLAWVRSAQRVFVLALPLGFSVSINGGRASVVHDADPAAVSDAPVTGVYEYHSRYEWWFDGGWGQGHAWVTVPLWAPLLLVVGLADWLWRRDLRTSRCARAGLCPRCGYDCTGLAPAVACPECGTGGRR